MSVESAPSGAAQSASMGHTSGAAQTAERASAPVSTVSTHTDGGRFNESITHTAPLSPSEKSFSKDTPHSFRASDFRTIASAKANGHESAKTFQAERQSLEHIFKTSAPLQVSRTGHSTDTSQPFHANELRTVWAAPHSEKQSQKQETPPVIQQHTETVKHSTELKPSQTPTPAEKIQPFQHRETILWQVKPAEKHSNATPTAEIKNMVQPTVHTTSTEVSKLFSTPSKANQEVKNTVSTTHEENPAYISIRKTDRFASQVHVSPFQKSETKYGSRPEVEQQKDNKIQAEVQKSTNVHKVESQNVKAVSNLEFPTPLLEHQEVQKTLHYATTQQQEKVTSVHPEHEGSRVKFSVQTIDFMKAYKILEQKQPKTTMSEQVKPKVEAEKLPSAQVLTSIKPEIVTQPKATVQEKDAAAKTLILATEVTELMEQTGVQPATAQQKMLETVREVIKEQKLETAAKEILEQEIPDEKTEEFPSIEFNRDSITDAHRQAAALHAVVESVNEAGQVNGREVAETLPDGNVLPFKSELVKDEDETEDKSMRVVKDKIALKDGASVLEMINHISTVIDETPAVRKPQKEDIDLVTDRDVRRVFEGEQIAA